MVKAYEGRRRSIPGQGGIRTPEERAILFGQTARSVAGMAGRQNAALHGVAQHNRGIIAEPPHQIESAQFCRTMTWVPTGTRPNRSMTSSLTRRKQPDDTAWPIVSGALVPWMR